MSDTIKGNIIVGDLNVGRDIYSGGNANVMGNATIKRNLKVEGWLEAKNIKNFLKGLFPTMDALEDAYPEPQIGWAALIGDTLPANIVIVNEDGKWQLTSNKSDDLEVDLTNYVDNADLDTKLEGYYKVEDANELATRVGELEATADDAHNALVVATEASNRINDLNNAVQVNSENFGLAMGRIKENTDAIGVISRENAEQDSEINGIKQSVQANANSFHTIEQSLNMFKDEVETKQYQVDNKITNVETLNAKQTLWHEAHSIINLHRFVNFAVTESATFVDWMTQVPSQLIRNGLIVLINTSKGWESWQLVNADMYLEVTGYKKIDWDNSLVLTEINALKARIDNEVANLELEDSMINDKIEEINVAITAEIDLRKAKDAEQDGKISDAENQINAQQVLLTDMESTLTNHTDDVATLFAKIEALEAKVLKLEDFHTLDIEPL